MRRLYASFVGNGVSAAEEEEGDEGVGGRGWEDGRLGPGGGLRKAEGGRVDGNWEGKAGGEGGGG